MKDAIHSCIEHMEKVILELEDSPHAPPKLDEVLTTLGLRHLKLPSAQVITLFDMLADGIQPVTPELITALLSLTESYKQLLYAMGGFVTDKATEIQTKAAQAIAEDAPLAETGEHADAKVISGAASSGTFEDMPESLSDSMAGSMAGSMDDSDTSPSEDKETAKGAGANGQAPAKKKDNIVSVRVNTEKLDNLIEWVGKLMVTYAVLSQNKNLDSSTIAGLREMDSVIGRIKNEVDKIRLVPLKQIFMPMHRLITSTAQKINKRVELTIIGDDLELDKTIVENLNEPMVHILRNSVDHGIEPLEDRKTAGKPETGSVTIEAWRKGDFAYISIRDDGRGLDPAKIRRKAAERGLLENREYSDSELYQFIMHSGFSTAEKVTDISGRGVGMDAVVNAVKVQLNGDVQVESELGAGTRVLISMPLDRSANEGIVDALITRIGTETFIIPSRDVLEVYAARKKDTIDMPDGTTAVNVRGEIFPLVPLSEYFAIPSKPTADGYLHTIVVKVGDTRAALLIDEVLSQQQAVVTGFTIPVQEIYAIPILGYGMLGENDALVVDVENLIDRLKASEGSLAYQTWE